MKLYIYPSENSFKLHLHKERTHVQNIARNETKAKRHSVLRPRKKKRELIC